MRRRAPRPAPARAGVRTWWVRLAVVLVAGRLLLDVATPFLPGAFVFAAGPSLEAVDAWDARIAAPSAPAVRRPARDCGLAGLVPAEPTPARRVARAAGAPGRRRPARRPPPLERVAAPSPSVDDDH